MSSFARALLRLAGATSCATIAWTGCCGCAARQPVAPASLEVTSAAVALPALPAAVLPGVALTATAPVAGARQSLDDGQIARILADLDASVIQAAKGAAPRARNPRVRQLAEQIADTYSRVEQELFDVSQTKGILFTDSAVARKLAKDERVRERALAARAGARFDSEYIVGQVVAQQDILDLLDEQLLPNVRDPGLRSSLQAMRVAVVEYLVRAKELQVSLWP